MENNWRKNLDVLSNIALIICCLLFIFFLTKKYFVADAKPEVKSNAVSATLVGRKLSNVDVDWSKNQQTLLIVLQEGCRFCEESVTFYQHLVKELSSQNKTHIMAVLPQNIDKSKKYLKDKMVEIPDVLQASSTEIGVRGTPTLILIDNTGTVLEQWTGKLPNKDIEEKVIQRLRQ